MLLNKIKTKIWYKYIFYYCVIFLVPFIVLSTLVYKFSVERVEDQFESSVKNSLEQSEKLMSTKIEELENIAMHMITETYISSFMMNHDYYGMIGKEIISSYTASQVYLDDIILFYFNDNRYYSSKGAYNEIDVLIDKYYKDINISKKIIRDTFYLSTPQLILLPKSKKDDTCYELYYIFPLFSTDGHQYGTVTFLFNKDRLKSILPSFNKENINEMYVVNNSGLVVLNNNGDTYKEFANEKGQITSDILRSDSYKTETEEYKVQEIQSKELGLRFISFTNNKGLVSSLSSTKLLIIKILITLFSVGLLLIMAISYLQYLPIRKIYETLGNKKREEVYRSKNDELENIKKLVIDIICENKELLVKNRALDRIDENQLLLEIIEGVSSESENMHPFIAELQGKGYSYYIALIKKSQLSVENKTLIHNIFPIEKENYRAFTIQIPLQSNLGILVIHTNPEFTQEESLKDIQCRLSILSDDLFYYCGRIYNELLKVNHSYIEAMVACDYLVNDNKEKFVLYRVTSSTNEYFLKYPTDIEEKLDHGIKQGTEEVVMDSLKQIFNFIYLNRYYCDEIKIYSYYLINFIVKSAAYAGFSRENIKFKNFIEYSTLEELEAKLLDLVREINSFVKSKREKERDKHIEEIELQILNNYTSHDLSLESLAKKYDYSVPYLSKLIKEETGMTFTKYIQELRFNYVKNQLIKTKVPIKEIIYQVGYYDISNFSRKFKSIVGVTPGQFRELNKNELEIEAVNEYLKCEKFLKD